MKTSENAMTLLSDDILQIGNTNPVGNLNLNRLIEEHFDPYLFADNKPVLNISQDEFVGIFDLQSGHYFLSIDQAFRLGTYCELAMPKLIALMMKADWEGFLSEMTDYHRGEGLDLRSKLCNTDLVEMYMTHYKPNDGKIFNLVKDIPYGPKKDTTFGHIQFYIQDLLEGNIFLFENEYIGDLYAKNEISEKMLLFEIPELQRATYLRLKQIWQFKSEELDEFLLLLERKKRLNIGIENNYYKTFGHAETIKASWTYKVEKYKMIVKIMKDHPELSYRELHKIAIDKLVEADKERSELSSKIARSLNCIGAIFGGGPQPTITSEFQHEYMTACKKLLRKLFFLLHSDTTPGFAELSQKKKAEINKLWLQLMKSTKNELFSFSPEMLLYSLPDIEQLEEIYKQVCKILEINPGDFEFGNRLEFMIRKGTSIEKILEFLEAETDQIELQLAHLELIKAEYTHEDQSQIYRTALANIDEHSEKLKSDVAKLEKQTVQLKKKISNGFKEVDK